MTESKQHSIVVGIDGSAASKSALRWAVEEARVRGSTVTAVHVWKFPARTFEGYGAMAAPMVALEDLEKAAEQAAHATVAEVVGSDLSVPVNVSVRRGHPAHQLVEASADAELLVVGSEGHGGFVGMLLGSVSTAAVHHAKCAVVVVRPPAT